MRRFYMALKDLIAEQGALDEPTIERIVAPYARYDVNAKKISFVPSFARLSNRAKILVYLVALQGWKYVTDETVPADARPVDIQEVTGIPGGSLRPTLRDLSDCHVLTEQDSRYSVRSVALATIETEIGQGADATGSNGGSPARKTASRRVRPKSENSAESPDVAGIDDAGDPPVLDSSIKRPRKIARKTGNIAATFDRWVTEGYFDDPRTLADVQARFRKEAIMVPQTSLPGYFLGAVRKGQLKRDEVEVGGKTVWAYTTVKKVAA
jgi:hypothetical protein